jgi:hypothetical protein
MLTYQNEKMNTYGVAIALTQVEKDNTDLAKVVLTPINVSDPNEGFDPLDIPGFPQIIDFCKPETVFKCFRDVVKTIASVVNSQIHNFEDQENGYRPIWIMPGRSSHDDIIIVDKLLLTLFPKEASKILYNLESFFAYDEHDEDEKDFIKCCTFNGIFLKGIEGTKEELKQYIDTNEKVPEEVIQRAGLFLKSDANMRARYNTKNNHIALSLCRHDLEEVLGRRNDTWNVASRAEQYLSQNPKVSKEVEKAFNSLAFSLDHSRITLGNFSGGSSSPRNFDVDVAEFSAPVISGINHEMKCCKVLLDRGDTLALDYLNDIAYGAGFYAAKSLGHSVSHAFAFPLPSQDYSRSKELQDRYPAFGAYLTWHPEIWGSFLLGFRENSGVSSFRDLKKPFDSRNPFFTDPLSWYVRQELRIALGLDIPEYSESNEQSHKKEVKKLRNLVSQHSSVHQTNRSRALHL